MDVTVKNLRKFFGDKAVFRDFSHTFPQGKTTCVMGPSGCGKTTLLNLLLGLELPDSGEISGMEGKRKSAVFQEDRLCESNGAVSNLRLVNPSLSRRQAEAMLSELGLSDSLRQPVREFSGGMKRRVAILRALCADWDILLADEPFRGLDRAGKERVLEYFQQKTAGRTVILVTHDPDEAVFFGGECCIIPFAGLSPCDAGIDEESKKNKKRGAVQYEKRC